ncbi:MAG: cbb3-type cytochrome c oxidase subunit I [Gaiellaceae bacterium]
MSGYVQPLPGVLAGAHEERSRICAVTGLRVYAGAQTLTLVNAVAAVLALAVGGLFGMLIGFTRAPGWELLGPKSFYAALTGHGVAALILWPVFFEVAAMVFASSILLNARVYSMKLGWTSFGLMVVGSFLLIGVILSGHASVGFTAYPPLVANQMFYLGYLIFAVGVLLAIANFALSIVAARNEVTFTGSLPLLTYGVACAAILALVAILSGLVALVPAWLYSLGWIGSVEPIVYRGWFWGLGHTLQYVNVIAMVVAWYGIAALTLKAGPVNQKFTRFAFILYLIITVPVLGHHFLVDPSIGTDVKIVGGTAMGFGLGIPSLMHGLAVMGGVEATQRAKGVTGLFGWLRSLKWSHAGIAAMAGSLLLFALGGWTGTAETTLQLNMVSHNTMWVPAHIHQVVVGGTTLAFMGFAYYLVPLLTCRRLWSQRLATIQAYLYGGGLLLMTSAQGWAGTLGVPRRVASIAYGGETPHGWALPMNIAGVGAGLASFAGALFVFLMVMTLVGGKRSDDPAQLVPSAAR